MHFLFLFLDGVGLGGNDAQNNPIVSANTPTLNRLLNGKPLVREVAPLVGGRATLLALDATLGVDGLPQSATGQAALLTGKNVPKLVGEHYGPKPNKKVTEVVRADNLFIELSRRGYRAALLNAYPQRYFDAVASGRRLYSAIPLAVTSAGIPLKTAEDLYAGKALSVDFTGEGWAKQLGYKDAPVMKADEAGRRLAALAQSYDLAFFEFWPSDYAGHHQDPQDAIEQLERIDAVLSGLLAGWNDAEGLILITSDHGNMEDLNSRHHTTNPVPALVIGAKVLRDKFCQGLVDLSDVTPAILQFYPAKA